jgi:hypothetical protein
MEALIEQAEAFGWSVETTEATVTVPDEDKVVSTNWDGSARRLGRKQVPGFQVAISNQATTTDRYGASDEYRVTLYFTETGALVKEMIGGGDYRVRARKGVKSLGAVLEVIESQSVAAIADRRARLAAQDAQRQAERDAKVAAAYAEAVEYERRVRKGVLDLIEAELKREVGMVLTPNVARTMAAILLERLEKSDAIGELLGAVHKVERTGKGWLPDQSYLTGTYVNGVRVEG